MTERLVAVLGIGMLDEVKVTFFGVRHGPPMMRTLILTDQRAVFAVVATADDVDQSIKRHTPEYEAALIKLARNKSSEAVEKGSLDSLPDAVSINYSDVKRITSGSLILPKLSIERNDRQVFRFTCMDKAGFKDSVDALRQIVPDKF